MARPYSRHCRPAAPSTSPDAALPPADGARRRSRPPAPLAFSGWPSSAATSRICASPPSMSLMRSTVARRNPSARNMRWVSERSQVPTSTRSGSSGTIDFRAPSRPRERARPIGHDRHRRIGRIGRERRDLAGIGERHHELIGADVERHDPPRRIGGAGVGQSRTQAQRTASAHAATVPALRRLAPQRPLSRLRGRGQGGGMHARIPPTLSPPLPRKRGRGTSSLRRPCRRRMQALVSFSFTIIERHSAAHSVRPQAGSL